MLHIRHLTFFLVLLWTSEVCSTQHVTYSEKQSTQALQLEEKVIEGVVNPDLQEKLHAILKGNYAVHSSKQNTYLLLAAMEEGCALQLISFLIPYYQAKHYRFDAHQIMLKALETAPIRVVRYLLDKGVYNKAYLSKKKQYGNFLLQLDKLHVGYILLWDSLKIRILPQAITYVWSMITLMRAVIWLLSFPFSFFERLNTNLQRYFSYINFLFTIKAFIIFYLIRIFISLYKSIIVSHKPGYIFHLFKQDVDSKAKNELEEKALLLLEYGADPNGYALLVGKQHNLAEYLPKGFCLYTYRSTSVLHLAVQYHMTRLVEALIRLGAKVNSVGFVMKDTINYATNAEKAQSMNFPFDFVTARDLSSRKKGRKQTPLDLVTDNSRTAASLKEHGGKHYKDLNSGKQIRCKSD